MTKVGGRAPRRTRFPTFPDVVGDREIFATLRCEPALRRKLIKTFCDIVVELRLVAGVNFSRLGTGDRTRTIDFTWRLGHEAESVVRSRTLGTDSLFFIDERQVMKNSSSGTDLRRHDRRRVLVVNGSVALKRSAKRRKSDASDIKASPLLLAMDQPGVLYLCSYQTDDVDGLVLLLTSAA